MTNLPELMTVAEVADALRVTPQTVKRWIRTGRLEAVKLPSGHPRIARSVIADIAQPEQEAA